MKPVRRIDRVAWVPGMVVLTMADHNKQNWGAAAKSSASIANSFIRQMVRQP